MEWVEILFTYDDVEAQVVREALDDEDIQVISGAGRINRSIVNTCRMSEIRLLVRADEFEKAKTAIRIMREAARKDPGW